jgi:hypothetical protein
MKFGFALASAAAVAMITAHPVMASETLSTDSLPAAGVSIQPAASFGDSTRVGALRKGSRVNEAEGFLPSALLANPLFIVGGLVFTAGVLDALNIVNLGLINAPRDLGPYGIAA